MGSISRQMFVFRFYLFLEPSWVSATAHSVVVTGILLSFPVCSSVLSAQSCWNGNSVGSFWLEQDLMVVGQDSALYKCRILFHEIPELSTNGHHWKYCVRRHSVVLNHMQSLHLYLWIDVFIMENIRSEVVW
jgi:hypothetical protein